MIGGIQVGKLSTRMGLGNLPDGLYRTTAEGVNMILDALTEPLFMLTDYVHNIGKGNLPPKITTNYKGDFNTIKESLNATNDVLAGLIASKGALNNVSTGIMIADTDRDITYVNKSVQKLLKEAETSIRKQLPNFNADNLVGVNIDCFHSTPEHQARLLKNLTSSHTAMLEIGGRNLQVTVNPVIDGNGAELGTVAEWVDMTAELTHQAAEIAAREKEEKLSAENSRIRIALDNVSTNVMMADNEHNIIYMNKSIVGMLTQAEADVRKALPSFNVSRLMGSNIDQFHKKPSHQRGMLTSFTSTHRTQIQIGGRTFSLVANPVITEQGERLGSVVEWNDRTNEVAIESEVADIVNAAGQGNFTKRIELSGKEGFFLALGKDINTLMQTSHVGLSEVMRILDALSRGDLTEKITNEYQGMFGQLKDDCNVTVANLSKLVLDIKSAVEAINTAAKEIASGNTDLSHRTEQQAASLEETASSMEELASTVKQNADNAKQANQRALESSNVAIKGGNVVQQVVGTMNAINESAGKIVDIISVIDGIALQTNILALNAAVEAGRAGEQGRGFAVVASEVRNLAQRSAAAKEIKGLIGDSVEKVKDGSMLVSEAGKTMDEIVVLVNRVTDIMSEIASASAEQSSGIDQVNQAVNQMDEVTQQNAALVEQASAAAESLEEQADMLTETMAQFRLDSGTGLLTVLRPVNSPNVVQKPVPRLIANPETPKSKEKPAKPLDSDGAWTEF
ncbi:methyl-accepting chemotaxis protein II [Methyloglobulus morosus KoM1]|uniref:Methyl-accepting chemotaxis protein II n=1 Tax=Methyloglobulus morosus KoM1 TaxID=1116472 RepID=V5C1F4_9GAMM|nr:methyl-accepting chemotaxis protein [Methyloglobulus morosus]ESS73939.1 methyl-accepting chemotaxis protein II [Methyloglobulus morosus KoM1]